MNIKRSFVFFLSFSAMLACVIVSFSAFSGLMFPIEAVRIRAGISTFPVMVILASIMWRIVVFVAALIAAKRPGTFWRVGFSPFEFFIASSANKINISKFIAAIKRAKFSLSAFNHNDFFVAVNTKLFFAGLLSAFPRAMYARLIFVIRKFLVAGRAVFFNFAIRSEAFSRAKFFPVRIC